MLTSVMLTKLVGRKSCTPPKFNGSLLKNDSWKTSLSFWVPGKFSGGEVFNFQGVSLFISWYAQWVEWGELQKRDEFIEWIGEIQFWACSHRKMGLFHNYNQLKSDKAPKTNSCLM